MDRDNDQIWGKAKADDTNPSKHLRLAAPIGRLVRKRKIKLPMNMILLAQYEVDEQEVRAAIMSGIEQWMLQHEDRSVAEFGNLDVKINSIYYELVDAIKTKNPQVTMNMSNGIFPGKDFMDRAKYLVLLLQWFKGWTDKNGKTRINGFILPASTDDLPLNRRRGARPEISSFVARLACDQPITVQDGYLLLVLPDFFLDECKQFWDAIVDQEDIEEDLFGDCKTNARELIAFGRRYDLARAHEDEDELEKIIQQATTCRQNAVRLLDHLYDDYERVNLNQQEFMDCLSIAFLGDERLLEYAQRCYASGYGKLEDLKLMQYDKRRLSDGDSDARMLAFAKVLQLNPYWRQRTWFFMNDYAHDDVREMPRELDRYEPDMYFYPVLDSPTEWSQEDIKGIIDRHPQVRWMQVAGLGRRPVAVRAQQHPNSRRLEFAKTELDSNMMSIVGSFLARYENNRLMKRMIA